MFYQHRSVLANTGSLTLVFSEDKSHPWCFCHDGSAPFHPPLKTNAQSVLWGKIGLGWAASARVCCQVRDNSQNLP